MSTGKQLGKFLGAQNLHLDGQTVRIHGAVSFGSKLFNESESLVKWKYSVDSRHIQFGSVLACTAVPRLLYEPNEHFVAS